MRSDDTRWREEGAYLWDLANIIEHLSEELFEREVWAELRELVTEGRV